jgi:hypothetical protein
MWRAKNSSRIIENPLRPSTVHWPAGRDRRGGHGGTDQSVVIEQPSPDLGDNRAEHLIAILSAR